METTVQHTWLTRKQLCEMLQIKTVTAESWVRKGEGPPYVKLAGGRAGSIRYRLDEVESWLESRRVTSPA